MATLSISPTSTAPGQAWAPDKISVFVRGILAPNTEVQTSMALDMRPLVKGGPALSQTSFDSKMIVADKITNEKSDIVRFTKRERATAVGVRDALAGTRFLADAVEAKDGNLPALAANTMRIAFTDQQGAQRYLDLPVLEPADGYRVLYTALDVYGRAARL